MRKFVKDVVVIKGFTIQKFEVIKKKALSMYMVALLLVNLLF